MFNVFAAKSSKMEEFEQAQAQMTDQVSNTLRDGWVSSLKQVIRGSLRDVGKDCRKVSCCLSQYEPSSCAEQQVCCCAAVIVTCSSRALYCQEQMMIVNAACCCPQACMNSAICHHKSVLHCRQGLVQS